MLAESPRSLARALDVPSHAPDVEPSAPAADWMTLLEDLSQLGAESPMPEILAAVVDATVAALGADGGSLGLWDPERNDVAICAHADRPRPARATRFAPGEGVAGRVASSREAVLIADTAHDSRYISLDYPRTSSLLSVPMLRDDELIGTLTVTSVHPNAFDEADAHVLRLFATQAASLVVEARRASSSPPPEPSDDPWPSGEHADLAHDLKGPLNSIRGLLALILMDEIGPPLSPDQRDLLDHARMAGERLQATIERLVDRPSSVADERPALQPTAFSEVAAAVVARLQGIAADAGVTIEFQVPDGLPRVQADPFQLARVLENLVDNAAKFGHPSGHVWLRAALVDDRLECAVRDDGVGIPVEALARVFDRGYRAPAPGPSPTGSGLGLAICRRIIEQHGGQIRVDSVEGGGTTVSFTLRLAEPS